MCRAPTTGALVLLLESLCRGQDLRLLPLLYKNKHHHQLGWSKIVAAVVKLSYHDGLVLWLAQRLASRETAREMAS